MEKAKNKESKEEIVEIVDDDEDEDVNMFLRNEESKSKRTSPMTEAEVPKSTGAKSKTIYLTCDICEYATKDKQQLNEHIENHKKADIKQS